MEKALRTQIKTRKALTLNKQSTGSPGAFSFYKHRPQKNLP